MGYTGGLRECIYCNGIDGEIWVAPEGYAHKRCHNAYLDAQTATIADIQKLAPCTTYGVLEDDILEMEKGR